MHVELTAVTFSDVLKLRWLLFGAICLLAAGCSGADTGTEAPEDAVVDNVDPQAELQAENAESGFEEELTAGSQSELAETITVPVLRYEERGNDLDLFFEMASQQCYGVSAEHVETPEVVTVTLTTGLLPDVGPDDCGIGVYTYTLTVGLDGPLDGRDVLTVNNSGETLDVGSGASSSPEDETEVAVNDEGSPAPEQFEGMTIEDASDLADGNSVTWAVSVIDGEAQPDVASNVDVLFELEENTVVEASHP